MEFLPLRRWSDLASQRWGMPLRILSFSLLAVLLPGPSVFGQNQGQPPSKKSRHVSRTLPLAQFYDTPDPLPLGKPGELIRFEEAYEYHLSYEASTFRILYHSRSPDGKDVAVSGIVMVPDGTPPAGGWPMVAWAHDFTGSARQCAPSLLKNLNEGPLLSMYASLGYAVVASDYAGLGTNFPYAVFDTRSNTLDLLYAILAARGALPQLGQKWVVAGYSQGANVAVGVAEAESTLQDANYSGAVAVASVSEPDELFQQLARGSDQALLLHLAQGIKTVFPDFQVEKILSGKAMLLYARVSQSCEAKLDSPLPVEDLLKSDWQANVAVRKFFARNILGGRPAAGPLLIISGESDPVVPSTLTANAVSRLCAQKDRVLFVQYPGRNASEVLANSLSEQISWIRARFSGLPAPGNCP